MQRVWPGWLSLSALCQSPLWQLEVSLSLGGPQLLKCSDVKRGTAAVERTQNAMQSGRQWSLELLTNK